MIYIFIFIFDCFLFLIAIMVPLDLWIGRAAPAFDHDHWAVWFFAVVRWPPSDGRWLYVIFF